MFGFELIIAIIIIHLVKYPSLNLGATPQQPGRNILHGYKARKMGDLDLSADDPVTMFIVQARCNGNRRSGH